MKLYWNRVKKQLPITNTHPDMEEKNDRTKPNKTRERETHTHRVYLFAHCLHCSCTDFISYRIWIHHMSTIFQSCDVMHSIVVICISMNTLLNCASCILYPYIILCLAVRSYGSTSIITICNSILLFNERERVRKFFFWPSMHLFYKQFSIWIFNSWKWIFTHI